MIQLRVALLGVLLCSACTAREEGRTPDAYEVAPADEPPVIGETAAPQVSSDDDDLPTEAPPLRVATLSGDTFELDAHRGEVVLVNFWATWCAPCVVEMPDLVEMQRDFADRGFTVLGVSVDEGNEEAVRTFVSDMGINYPIAIDLEVGDAFGGVYGLPTTFVIDRSGRIVHRVIGLFPTESMRPEIEKLLQERA